MAVGKSIAKTVKGKVITCILPKGKARPILKKIKSEKEIHTINVRRARGEPLETDGLPTEKDILTIVVPDSSSDELFEFLYEECQIEQPNGAFIHMSAGGRITPFNQRVKAKRSLNPFRKKSS